MISKNIGRAFEPYKMEITPTSFMNSIAANTSPLVTKWPSTLIITMLIVACSCSKMKIKGHTWGECSKSQISKTRKYELRSPKRN